ncbi:MAG: glycosyltransferase, partial [Anaerolineales bacterium]
PVRLVTLGRLVLEKSQSVMVKAVYEMAMRNLSASLTIIGSGPLEPSLSRLIHQLNLADSVFLLGFQENPYEWLAQADFFILTSLWESLSLALMEAMALGLPAIATATGGTPELITHLENGYLIPPNSPQALADAVEYLSYHPDVAHQMGEKAQKHIFDHYTIPKIADQLENYYLRLLQQ